MIYAPVEGDPADNRIPGDGPPHAGLCLGYPAALTVSQDGARRVPATGKESSLIDSGLMPVSAPESGTMPPGEQGAVGLGVIGLGAFGRFCLEAYVTMPGIRVVAIADPDPDALA